MRLISNWDPNNPPPLPFAPVMENFVVPHAAEVLAAIKRTVGKA